MKRWTLKDIKDKGIFIDEKGVGRVLAPTKKVVTEKDIEKALKKAKNGKNRLQANDSKSGLEGS
jgi:hypothetical protein